jgi:hypothetical protein
MRRPCVSGSAKVTWTEADPEAASLTPPRSWTLARPVHDLPVSNISEVRVPRSYAVCILRLYSPNHVEGEFCELRRLQILGSSAHGLLRHSSDGVHLHQEVGMGKG